MQVKEQADIQQVTRAIEASYQPTTANDESLTVEVTMSSETPYPRRSWDGLVNEVLSHDPAHVRLGRMQSGAPVLDNHSRFGSVDKDVIGVVEAVRIENGQMTGTVRFAKDERGRSIYAKVKDGILRKLSIGYTVYKYTDTEVEGQLTTRTVVDWEPYEVSIVSVPADDTAQTRNQDQITNTLTMKDNVADTGTTSVATEETRAAAPAVAAAPPVVATLPTEDHTRTAVTAERDRVQAIINQVRMAGLDNSVAETLITDGTALADATRQITTQWQAAQVPATNGTVDATVVNDNTRAQQFINDLAGSILHRAGMADGEMTEGERQYANMSMARRAEAILRFRGENTNGLTDYQIVKRAFTRAGGHSTSDFPIIFGNVINRTLARAYAYQERTFTKWARATTHSDFRKVEKARLSSMNGFLDIIPEGGEYKAGTFSESVEGYAVHKYGKLLTYTWEMAVNDDMSFFQRIPAAFALAAAQRQSDLVYTILSGNPVMNDGNPLFHASHNNLMAAAAITDASIALAETAFLTQTDESGNYINVKPKYLVVGPSRKHEAMKLLASVSPNETSQVNLYAGAFELIVDPRVGTAWYLIADPNMIDTVEYAFLAGYPELYTESTENFNVDGTQVKARMVFGAKALDWRGMLKNPGL